MFFFRSLKWKRLILWPLDKWLECLWWPSVKLRNGHVDKRIKDELPAQEGAQSFFCAATCYGLVAHCLFSVTPSAAPWREPANRIQAQMSFEFPDERFTPCRRSRFIHTSLLCTSSTLSPLLHTCTFSLFFFYLFGLIRTKKPARHIQIPAAKRVVHFIHFSHFFSPPRLRLQPANGLFRHCVALFPESALISAALSMGRREEERRTKESYSQSSAETVTFEGEEMKKSRERARARHPIRRFNYLWPFHLWSRESTGGEVCWPINIPTPASLWGDAAPSDALRLWQEQQRKEEEVVSADATGWQHRKLVSGSGCGRAVRWICLFTACWCCSDAHPTRLFFFFASTSQSVVEAKKKWAKRTVWNHFLLAYCSVNHRHISLGSVISTRPPFTYLSHISERNNSPKCEF